MSTLALIICTLALYGFFAIAKDIGKYLKRQREAQEAQENANKILEQHGKDKGTGTN